MPKPKNEPEVIDETLVQLATRIPKPLHRAVKMHCTATDESVMEFTTRALGSLLEAETTGKSKGGKGRK